MTPGRALAVAPTPEELARFPLNDLGNAQRLLRLTGAAFDPVGGWDLRASTLLYMPASGWIGFDGTVWNLEIGEELARRAAHGVASALAGSFDALQVAWPHEPAVALIKFCRAAGSAASTSAMLRQAQSYLTVGPGDFDRDPLAIHCVNGTVRIVIDDTAPVLKFTPGHDPADRFTRITRAAYDPDAVAPLFERVWRDAFRRSAAERDYLHKALGYSVLGLTREQVFFILQGKGRDGKSTLLDAVRLALGDYAVAGDVATFLEGRAQTSSGPTPDLARLAGDTRLVILSEPPTGSAWNEGRLKAWTGGVPITARELHARATEFVPVGKLVVECNAFPRPRASDDGFWRRCRVILFRHQVAPDQVDMSLPVRIVEGELSGVLNWALAGAQAYLSEGLTQPASLEDFAGGYRASSSPMAAWFAECCAAGEAADGVWTAAKDIRASLDAWWEAEGHDPQKRPSLRALGDFLTNMQVESRRSRTGNVQRGPLRLLSDAERRAAHEASADRPASVEPVDLTFGDEGTAG